MPVTRVEADWQYGFLEFYDTARNHVTGIRAPVKIFDDFNGPAIDNTNDWNVTAVGAGAATADAGWMILTTAGADDDNIEVASELIFNGTNFCVMEARVRNDDVAHQAVCVGFTDAITEGVDDLAIFGEGAALTTEATDAAMFYHDPDLATDLWRAVCVDTDVDGTEISTATTPVNGTICNFRIAIDDNGYAYFWFSTGTTALSYIGADVTVGVTPGTALCAYVGSINREDAVNTCDVDFIRAWGGKID